MSRRASRMRNNYEKVLTKFFAEHPEHASLRRMAWSYCYLDGAWSFLDEGDERIGSSAHVEVGVFEAMVVSEIAGFESFPRARIIARLVLGRRLFRRIPRILPSDSQ